MPGLLKPEALVLSNLRTFEGVHTLDLHPELTVLVGKNNTGKSTLLEALYVIGSEGEAQSRVQSLERAQSTGAASLKIKLPVSRALEESADLPAHFLRATGLSIGPADTLVVEEQGYGLVRVMHGEGAIAFTSDGISERKRPGLGWEGKRQESGDVAQWQRLYRLVRGGSRAYCAYWSQFGVREHPQEHKKRMPGSDENRLRSAFTFLRFNHPARFEQLERTIVETLPEFEGVEFREQGDNDLYVPLLRLRGRETAVTRNSFGAGAWAFICVLTAAHVARVTSAQFLLLDEPTLFMHPPLERKLVMTLIDREYWQGAPLPLVIATHSAMLADMGLANGGLRTIDWKEQDRGTAHIVACARGNAASSFSRSEAVYSRPFLFVEGPGDKAALDLLSRDVVVPCTVVPIGLADLFLLAPPKSAAGLQVLARTSAGFADRARVMFDRDKEEEARKRLEKISVDEQPFIFFAGDARGQDLESCFCVFEFLADLADMHLGAERLDGFAPPAEWRLELRERLRTLGSSRGKGKGPIKGCHVIEWFFTIVLGQEQRKPAFLAQLAEHALRRKRDALGAAVWGRLEEVLLALDATRVPAVVSR